MTSPRIAMLQSQLATNRLRDPRLAEAIASVPREAFVAPSLQGVAYVDEDISVGEGRFLMEPMVFARLAEALEIQPEDRVLEIGSGTGYGAAVLSRLAGKVYALEENPSLHGRCRAAGLGSNVVCASGALALGHPLAAPYDAILLAGMVDDVPEIILEQLRDGGRLAAVVRRKAALGQAWLWRRTGSTIGRTPLFDAAIPPLPGFERGQGFVF